MIKFFHKINKVMAELSGISLGLIMFLILIDIIGRTFSKAIFGPAEMAVFCMITTVYLGLPYCEQKEGHIRVEILLTFLPAIYKKILNVISYLLVFGIWLIIVPSIGTYALSAYKNKEAVAGPTPLVIYPVLIVMLISSFFYWIQIGINLITKIKELLNKNN